MLNEKKDSQILTIEKTIESEVGRFEEEVKSINNQIDDIKKELKKGEKRMDELHNTVKDNSKLLNEIAENTSELVKIWSATTTTFQTGKVLIKIGLPVLAFLTLLWHLGTDVLMYIKSLLK